MSYYIISLQDQRTRYSVVFFSSTCVSELCNNNNKSNDNKDNNNDNVPIPIGK